MYGTIVYSHPDACYVFYFPNEFSESIGLTEELIFQEEFKQTGLLIFPWGSKVGNREMANKSNLELVILC